MNFYTLFLCFCFTLFSTNPCAAQSTWEQLANHPSPGIERPFSFEIDGVVYVGGGRANETTNVATMQAYDVATDTWTRKANFPGGGRRNAFAFQIGGIGYMGTGFDGNAHVNDFWKYDPAVDTWTQLDDFPGDLRSHALALAGDSTAYVLLGGREIDNTFKKDMWKFNPVTESWTALDNFPGSSRWRAFGWIIGQKLYAGGGARFPSQGFRDVYVYDLVTDTWNENRRAVCPTRKSTAGFFFTINGKGYYGEGSNGVPEGIDNLGTKLFAYDPASDSWTEEVEFIGPERMLGFSAVVDNKAIVGLGRDYALQDDYNDVYSFTPGTTASIPYAEGINLKVFPNPVSSSKLSIQGAFIENNDIVVSLFDMKGTAVQLGVGKINRAGPDLMEVEVDHLESGVYQLEMIHGGKRFAVRFIRH